MKRYRGLNGAKTKWIYADINNVLREFQHNGVWKDTVEIYNFSTNEWGKTNINLYEEYQNKNK